MRIVTILGSPRRHGNTAAVLRTFEEMVCGEHSIERINIIDYHVEGCLGCDGCQGEFDAPGCLQNDDGVDLLERLLAAELVVWAAPVYCWGFPAQIKALMDRCYCLVKTQSGRLIAALAEGQRAMLLLTCGGDAETNADLCKVAFEREMDYLRCTPAGAFTLPDAVSPAADAARARALAGEMARVVEGL